MKNEDLANMKFDVRADTGPIDNHLKIFNCYTCNNKAPFAVKCASYYESEGFINFEKDGECILSVMKANIAYVILASIDANASQQEQRKENYVAALDAEFSAGAITPLEYNLKIAELESNEKP